MPNRIPSDMAGEYQYGVMYNDGSVSRRWNGNTQEQAARDEVANYFRRYPNTTDNVRLVRRWIGTWENCNG